MAPCGQGSESLSCLRSGAIGYQNDRAAFADHAAGPVRRLRSAAKEDVTPRRPLDGGAGVLRDGEAAIRLGGPRLARYRPDRVDPDRRAERCESEVDREAALGRESDAFRAAGAGALAVLEEDVALVPAHHFARLRRMALQPIADVWPGGVLFFHDAH